MRRPAAIVLILCAGLIAACSGSTLPFSKASDAPAARMPPAIGVSNVSGLPAGHASAMFDALVDAAARRGISIGRGDGETMYGLAGAFEELASETGMAVRYRWTLTDRRGRVLHSIEDTESARASDGETPETHDIPVGRIAAYTAESLSSRLSQLGYATRAAGMPPPRDHLVEAGQGAEQQIDFETLHGPGMVAGAEPPADSRPPPAEEPATDRDVETQAASSDSIQGVAVTGVEGAGATGNGELAAAMARVLTDAGWPVRDSAGKNTLAIQGNVTLSAPDGPSQKVALRWTVMAPDGKVLGAVEQANDIPAGSLDSGWGKAADYAALAAADGIFDLVDKLR